MLAAVLDFALGHRAIVLFAVAAMAVAGVWSFEQLKLEAYPDISDPGVVVVTLYPGFAAEEVEKQVTVPIERALNNTPNVIARRSRTIFELSVVELTFTDTTNDYFARQVVLEKLRDADLPDGVTPTLGPLIGENLGVQRASIEGRDDGIRHSVRIGDTTGFDVEDVVPFGVETGEPARVTGIFHPAGSEFRVAKAKSADISLFGIEYQGKSGLSSAQFSWAA